MNNQTSVSNSTKTAPRRRFAFKIVLLCAVALLVFSLAGCGGGSSNNAGQVSSSPAAPPPSEETTMTPEEMQERIEAIGEVDFGFGGEEEDDTPQITPPPPPAAIVVNLIGRWEEPVQDGVTLEFNEDGTFVFHMYFEPFDDGTFSSPGGLLESRGTWGVRGDQLEIYSPDEGSRFYNGVYAYQVSDGQLIIERFPTEDVAQRIFERN